MRGEAQHAFDGVIVIIGEGESVIMGELVQCRVEKRFFHGTARERAKNFNVS